MVCLRVRWDREAKTKTTIISRVASMEVRRDTRIVRIDKEVLDSKTSNTIAIRAEIRNTSL